MCQLCQEAKLATTLKLVDTGVLVLVDGWPFMHIEKMFFKGRSIREYGSIVEELLKDGLNLTLAKLDKLERTGEGE
jgi:hypothetical protein